MTREKASLFLLVILLTFVHVYPLARAMPGTVVFVDPKDNNVKLGQNFTVSIRIQEVTGLLGFDFQLSYEPSILKLLDVQEGPFLKSVGPTMMINLTTNGNIWLAVATYSFQGIVTSANGSGILATATFKAISPGGSSLNLYSNDPYRPDEIKLAADPPPDSVVHIPNQAIDGLVIVSSDPADPPPPPDPPANTTVLVATVSSPKTIVGEGYSIPLNVTVTNQGSQEVIFYVACFANDTQIGKLALRLSSGTSTVASFLWNTTAFPHGTYSMTAEAWPITQQIGLQTSQQANAVTDSAVDDWIIVTVPGDTDGDFTVGISDAILLSSAFNSRPNILRWNSNTDINGDSVVDIFDATILANNYE